MCNSYEDHTVQRICNEGLVLFYKPYLAKDEKLLAAILDAVDEKQASEDERSKCSAVALCGNLVRHIEFPVLAGSAARITGAFSKAMKSCCMIIIIRWYNLSYIFCDAIVIVLAIFCFIQIWGVNLG